MGSIKTYQDLIVWQKGIELVSIVYNATKKFPEEERFGLSAQMRRCAISIPSNIAEGWGRLTQKNYIHFLRISRGSLFELETQVIIAKDLNYINDSDSIEDLITEISKMLNSLIKKIEEKI